MIKAAKKNFKLSRAWTIKHRRPVPVQPGKYDSRQCLEENSLLDQITNSANYIQVTAQPTEWLRDLRRCFVENKPNANPDSVTVDCSQFIRTFIQA